MTVRRPGARDAASPSESPATHARAATSGRAPELREHPMPPEALARRLVLERFAPVALLIAANGDALHVSGPIERLLPCPEGTPERERLRLASGGLADRVREVLASTSRSEGAHVVGSFGDDVPEGVRAVRLTVMPVPGADPNHRGARLVVLEEEWAGSPTVPATDGMAATARAPEAGTAGGLAAEEELGALYAMLQSRTVDLRNANTDLVNLLGSIRDATLCLDRHLRLKWYNDAAAGLLGLGPEDRGRSIQDLARRFGDESLAGDAGDVLRSLAPIERERPGADGRRLVRRIRPFRGDPERVDGVVVTLAESRERPAADPALRARAASLERSVATRMRDLDLLRGAVDAANRGGTLDETLTETCRLLCEHGDWGFGRALLASADEAGVFADSGAGWAAPGGRGESVVAAWRAGTPAADGDPLRALLGAGSVVWLGSPERFASAPWVGAAIAEGFRHALLVPIRAGLRSTGALVLLDERGEEPDEATRQLLGLVGATAGRAVERDRVTRRLTEMADEERRRIAQELHDGVGQELAGLGLLTASLLRDTQGGDLDATERIASIDHEVGALRARVRALTMGLLPVELRGPELEGALGELCARFSRLAGVDCRFECADGAPPVGDDVATHLHGIAQEAVRNAVQHGRASRVRVQLGGSGRLVLRIVDDGVGMDLTRRPGGGGLRIMRHRADLIGGTLTFESSGRGGVIVTCSVAAPAREARQEGGITDDQ